MPLEVFVHGVATFVADYLGMAVCYTCLMREHGIESHFFFYVCSTECDSADRSNDLTRGRLVCSSSSGDECRVFSSATAVVDGAFANVP